MKFWSRIAVSSWALSVATLAHADPLEALVARLDALTAYSAGFIQQLRGPHGELLERSKGQVLLLRPHFRWEITEPYPQIILADEQYLRVYDPDLAQVTLRALDEVLADTPVSLLTQSGADLAADFSVVQDGEEQAYVLEPLSLQSAYSQIRLAFDQDTLVGLSIVDQLGQVTDIEFTPAPEGTAIQFSDFSLTLPAGTDVIGG